MAKTKKYKSVSSYLRAHGQGLNYNLPRRGRDHEQQRAAAKVEQRNILNNLLPQLGLPMLDTSCELLEGIEQLLVMGGWTDVQANALRDCQKWLKNFRIVTITSSAPVEPVKTERGLVSYHVHGFKRDDHNVKISMIVDAGMGGAFEIAEPIAGPDYCCHAASNIDHLVPDSAKNKLFFSDEELYAAVPEMRPREVTRRRRRTVVRKPEATAQPVEPVRRKKPPLSPADWRR